MWYMNEGSTHANRSIGAPMYVRDADPGIHAPGITAHDTQPTLEQYENIFGPAARDIKFDLQRNKRHQRWHLPDVLKGANAYLTDRVDGLITDATNSPFTRNILPYVYLENPDQKLKWNVYSFDEGMASRVPYEAAARVLPQTKRSFAGYVVRQGLAIQMEHNFMVSDAGRLNFKRQLMQLVGSIQLTNDLDVHVALITAPSYQKHVDEKYMDSSRTVAQICREYSDVFGMMQKTSNALDFIIEDAKTHLKTWGSQPPNFLLCNGALTVQLTMIPEKTNYLTNGPEGTSRLAQGPDLPSYRGLSIINTRKFAMDSGTIPRDILRRRVRVSQHYHIPWHESNYNSLFEFYDEGKDSFFTKTWMELYIDSLIDSDFTDIDENALHINESKVHEFFLFNASRDVCRVTNTEAITALFRVMKYVKDKDHWMTAMQIFSTKDDTDLKRMNIPKEFKHSYAILPVDLFVLRPNIEHEMLGVIIGRGGTQELGATFWGQTEMSCYDDAQHGVWGMSYKYHERAIVTNERNLIRLFDVSFDGYNGGMDDQVLSWMSDDVDAYVNDMQDLSKPFSGKSMMVMMCAPIEQVMPNPLLLKDHIDTFPDRGQMQACDISRHLMPTRLKNSIHYYMHKKYDSIGFAYHIYKDQNNTATKAAQNETERHFTSYHGYLAKYSIQKDTGARTLITKQHGTGHLGPCYEGVASLRMGRGMQMPKGPAALQHLI